MFICTNGPPSSHFDPHKYVVSWLKAGRHSSLDKPTGKQQKPVTLVGCGEGVSPSPLGEGSGEGAVPPPQKIF